MQALGHNIEMRLQNQRPTLFLARAVDAHDYGRVGVIIGKFRPSLMRRDCLTVHIEAVHGKTPRLQFAKNEILDGVFVPAQRRHLDQFLCKGDLIVKPVTDGFQDAVAQGGIKRHYISFHIKAQIIASIR